MYQRIKQMARDETKIMFGQQQFSILGAEGGQPPYLTQSLVHDSGVHGWIFGDKQARQHSPDELCDVKRMTGSNPAILGLDMHDLDYKGNITSHWVGRLAYERGEVITVSMHHSNPVTGNSPWVKKDNGDVVKTVQRILPGGDHHDKFKQILDQMADWANSFTDSNGKPIPAIFRFLHKLNGGWFWWGLHNKAQNTEQELIELYRYMVKYLRDQKGVHNFLYAYSPDKFSDKADYLKTYPGDDYVDVLGMDYYYSGSSTTKANFQRMVKDVVEMAEERGKVPAITETGYMNNGIDKIPNFWQDYILDVLKTEATTKRIAYVLAWANHCSGNGHCQLWVPYKGHPAETDFINNFYNDSLTVFSSDLTDMYH
ncbi:mannan endo-1,4-beta-mannosidase [Patella vulgata]|uniref:mannan endo-1,4-beta-mannosidase n=1 Tax=Patella vulgata TaxID=6465 RepID=UPI0024A83727|nr:mannan endo-1,4-beta-mannosidase [Patella vulgata]